MSATDCATEFMRSRLRQLAVWALVLQLPLSAMPMLQPQVKEYHPLGGTFATVGLTVFHQAQRQCEIAAAEIPGAGERVSGFGSCAVSGVYIAVAGSQEGEMLRREFALDVPAKNQGYAIRAQDGRVAIVGADAIGALYGAVTFRQMAEGGTVEGAVVRDWPDMLYRGAMSYARAIVKWGGGGREAVDELLRHKLNVITDFYRGSQILSEDDMARLAELCRYAEERGFWFCVWPDTSLYNQRTKPDGMTLQKWHCVSDARPHRKVEVYYCWADDRSTERAAARFARFLEGFGVSRFILVIHPVDGGMDRDPEMWSRRCADCRRKYGDDERWKASLAQFGIWSRVLRNRFPSALLGSCIYPYHADLLAVPAERRDAAFRQNVTDYWRRIAEGLADRDFFFNIWMPSQAVLPEYRQTVGERRLNYTDHYCISAGIFVTYHRFAASLMEEGRGNFFLPVSSDIYGHWEAILLAAEHTWDRNAPGSEKYCGGIYYDPLKDHDGPAVILEQTLPRICHTFWGAEIAPYMARALASGVLPAYIEHPAQTVSYWNKVRRNPMYDPDVRSDAQEAGAMALVEDTAARMGLQVTAASLVCEQLAKALPHAAALPSGKRRYFMYFAKRAPFWLAAARVQYALRQTSELLAAGRNEAVAALLDEAEIRMKADYDQAERNLAALADEPDVGGRSLGWSADRTAMQKLLDGARYATQAQFSPRRIGARVRVGIVRGDSAEGIRRYLERFANVEPILLGGISHAELDKCDCVFLTAGIYDKEEFFRVLPSYVRNGGGGVFFEGMLCGHERFDISTPFPEIVKTAPTRVENFARVLKRADGTVAETMYVDYFELEAGPAGKPVAFSVDGRPVVVCGQSGLGKVVFCGTVGVEGVNGTYVTAEKELFGINAEVARKAVEYFTGIRLETKHK